MISLARLHRMQYSAISGRVWSIVSAVRDVMQCVPCMRVRLQACSQTPFQQGARDGDADHAGSVFRGHSHAYNAPQTCPQPAAGLRVMQPRP